MPSGRVGRRRRTCCFGRSRPRPPGRSFDPRSASTGPPPFPSSQRFLSVRPPTLRPSSPRHLTRRPLTPRSRAHGGTGKPLVLLATPCASERITRRVVTWFRLRKPNGAGRRGDKMVDYTLTGNYDKISMQVGGARPWGTRGVPSRRRRSSSRVSNLWSNGSGGLFSINRVTRVYQARTRFDA